MVTGPLGKESLLLLHAALHSWTKEFDYEFVDLPWLVDTQYSALTRPVDRKDIETPYGVFVASGEQSFLSLWDKEKPFTDSGAPGYIGWTPCMRDEPVLDNLHQAGFMKAELFVPLVDATEVEAHKQLELMLGRQRALFVEWAKQFYGVRPRVTEEAIGPLQVDLLIRNIEVGSYGVREAQGKRYLYGTALALPRFTLALGLDK